MERPGRGMLLSASLLVGVACGHNASVEVQGYAVAQWVTNDVYDEEPGEGVCLTGNSAVARIHVLVAEGKFAEAQALIAEASAGGLLSKPHAARLLNDLARLDTRLGDIPATLQRARNFPSQLREHTLHQIEQMLKKNDFSIATKAQLKMAKKLILETPRLMEKGGDP